MKLTKQERKEVIGQIKELDESLGLLRENWMSAKGPNVEKYMKMIDKLLDERFTYMQKRDGKV